MYYQLSSLLASYVGQTITQLTELRKNFNYKKSWNGKENIFKIFKNVGQKKNYF